VPNIPNQVKKEGGKKRYPFGYGRGNFACCSREEKKKKKKTDQRQKRESFQKLKGRRSPVRHRGKEKNVGARACWGNGRKKVAYSRKTGQLARIGPWHMRWGGKKKKKARRHHHHACNEEERLANGFLVHFSREKRWFIATERKGVAVRRLLATGEKEESKKGEKKHWLSEPRQGLAEKNRCLSRHPPHKPRERKKRKKKGKRCARRSHDVRTRKGGKGREQNNNVLL